MLIQWHITEKCNLKCKHCYQEKLPEELDKEKLLEIIDKITSFNEEKKSKLHINITGGEPLIRKDFFDILDVLHSKKISFGVLTNGILINKENVKRLKNAKFVQLSVDGVEKTHDFIRGNGNFKKVLNAISILRKERIRVVISFTAHKKNYKEFSKVCKIARKFKVNKIWADRLIPYGSNNVMETLNSGEVKEFFLLMRKEREKKLFKGNLEISMGRALQFLEGGMFYKCSAGDNFFTIMTNGDVVPCRRMPIFCDNIFNNDLIDIYNSELFKKLRRETEPEECEKCFYVENCNGGLRCLSYALYGTPFKKDYGCYVNN
ncbi:MAG: radical SAM protein [Fusobacteriaceae bacterium]|nr:radical SAM protein [Fusobacteriaceae bacterium]